MIGSVRKREPPLFPENRIFRTLSDSEIFRRKRRISEKDLNWFFLSKRPDNKSKIKKGEQT